MYKKTKKIKPRNYLLKCLRYQEIPRFGMSIYKAGEGTGFTVAPVLRNIGTGRDTRSKVGGFSQSLQSAHSSHPDYSRNQCCSMSNMDHIGSCAQSRQCYTCDKMGHLRKECPTLQENQGMARGIGRPMTIIASSVRPTVTQALVQ